MDKSRLKDNIITVAISAIVTLIIVYMGVFLFLRTEDCDVYFLISNGRYIVNNGIPHNMFWGLDKNLPTMIQQWLCSVWVYAFYSLLGYKGINACKVFNLCIMSAGIYVSMGYFIPDRAKRFFITVLADFFIVVNYILVRPYPITVLNCFLLTGISYKYLKEKSDLRKYYLGVFLIYLFQANWQCASLIILCCFSACFIITKKGIDLRAVLSAIPAFVGGLINPNEIDAWTYTLKSYSATQVYVIHEMQRFNFTAIQLLLVAILVILYITSFKTWKKYPLWIHFMTLGCILSAMMSPRNVYMCVVPFAVLFAWGLKEYNFEHIILLKDFAVNGSIVIVVLLSISLCVEYKSAVNVPKDVIPEGSILYTSFNNGAYFINQGYQIYMDARPELYSEAFLGDKAYLQEAHDADYEVGFDRDAFVKKYGFEYFAVPNTTYMYQWCSENCELVYFDGMETYIFRK